MARKFITDLEVSGSITEGGQPLSEKYAASGAGGGGGATELNDLTDVNTGAATSGEGLVYNGTNWVPGTVSAGGGGSGEPLEVTKAERLVPDVLFTSGLTDDEASPITISNIPAGYEYLELHVQLRTDRAGQSTDSILLYMNGDTTDANYDRLRIRNRDGSVVGDASSTGGASLNCTAATATAGNFSGGVVTLPFYDKNFGWKWAHISNANTGGNDDQELLQYQWRNTDAITSLTLQAAIGPNFVSGCQIQLVGYKREEIVTDVDGGGGGSSPTLTVHTSGVAEIETVLDRVELVASSGAIDFTNISQQYDHLRVRLEARTDNAGDNDNVLMWLNNDKTAANYHHTRHYARNVSGATEEGSTSLIWQCCASSSPANKYGWAEASILHYTRATREQTIKGFYGIVENADTLRTAHTILAWDGGAAAINRITLALFGGDNFVSGTIAELIGVKRQDVVTSGTYGDLSIINGLIVP